MSSSEKKKSLIFNLQHGNISFLNFIFLVLLLSPAFLRAGAQPSNPSPDAQYGPYAARFNSSMAIIIVVLIAALFLMGFFSIYIRHCSDGTSAGGSVRQALSMRRRAAASRGLDAAVIENFPTFSYAEVKDHKIGKGALECAVCLNEFEEDETLRLIPKCDHVFHPECIDAWLESHVTCPVCRANLTPQPGDEPFQIPDLGQQTQQNEEVDCNQQQHEEVVIQVDSDHQPKEEEASVNPAVMKRNFSLNQPNRPPRSFSVRRPRMFGKFRSYSTGHMLVQPGDNLDRFTLKLPEGVRKDVITRAMLNRTGSTAAGLPRGGSSRRGFRAGGGGGEGSSRSVRFYQRMDPSDRAARSDRWVFSMAPPFFTRGPSVKSSKVMAENGEGSTSRSARTAVKLPSFKCLEPKGDETGLVQENPAHPPV